MHLSQLVLYFNLFLFQSDDSFDKILGQIIGILEDNTIMSLYFFVMEYLTLKGEDRSGIDKLVLSSLIFILPGYLYPPVTYTHGYIIKI